MLINHVVTTYEATSDYTSLFRPSLPLAFVRTAKPHSHTRSFGSNTATTRIHASTTSPRTLVPLGTLYNVFYYPSELCAAAHDQPDLEA